MPFTAIQTADLNPNDMTLSLVAMDNNNGSALPPIWAANPTVATVPASSCKSTRN